MIRRFFRHLIESLKKLETETADDDGKVSAGYDYPQLGCYFRLCDKQYHCFQMILGQCAGLQHTCASDIQDQSEQIGKDGQTVTNENYHKVYDALTAMKHVDKADFQQGRAV